MTNNSNEILEPNVVEKIDTYAYLQKETKRSYTPNSLIQLFFVCFFAVTIAPFFYYGGLSSLAAICFGCVSAALFVLFLVSGSYIFSVVLSLFTFLLASALFKSDVSMDVFIYSWLAFLVWFCRKETDFYKQEIQRMRSLRRYISISEGV